MSPEEQVKKKLDDITQKMHSIDIIQQIGDFAADLIKKRTQLGYGSLKQSGTKTKLKALSIGYKKQRKAMPLSSKTTANKSNLTQTGHMLNNLIATIKDNGQVEIGFQDPFAHDKATWNTVKGRPFNNLTEAEIKQLKLFIQKLIKNELKSS